MCVLVPSLPWSREKAGNGRRDLFDRILRGIFDLGSLSLYISLSPSHSLSLSLSLSFVLFVCVRSLLLEEWLNEFQLKLLIGGCVCVCVPEGLARLCLETNSRKLSLAK